MLLWLPVIIVIVLDGITKNLVSRHIIKADFVANYGLAFSLPSSKVQAIIITAAITAVLIFYYFWQKGSWSRIEKLGFALIVGGGAGNLLERLYRGSIIDFIHVGNAWLNVADLAIIVGIVILVFMSLRGTPNSSVIASEAKQSQ